MGIPIFTLMLVKTRGLILRNTRYGETSLIVDIYTRELGLQSYILQGARKARARMPAGLFQVMTLLDLVVYHQDKASLKRIKEASVAHHYRHLQHDVRPNAAGLFLIEMIRSALPHQEIHPGLFDFLEEAFLKLDDEGTPLTVSLFDTLIELTGWLGFRPATPTSRGPAFFDLREGVFCPHPPPYPEYLLPEVAELLAERLSGHARSVYVASGTRRLLLQGLVDYFRLHLDHFKPPRSTPILHQVLAL